ncbi:MAG: hypothetical protein RLZ25_1838 [Pseudomonadota bacterium]|jgi:hypothetical protein
MEACFHGGTMEGHDGKTLRPMSPILAGFDSFVLSDTPRIRD